MGVSPAESAGPGARAARLRAALIVLGSTLLFGVLVWVAYELAAARVPQHRAALEELIRHETGLEVSFSELSLRWGWYGPEAVFHAVELGEPGGAALLRAPRLIVALDAWSIARTGRLEARRITLDSPDIDLSIAPAAALRSRAPGRAPPAALSAGARILAHWRGGRIDIVGGALRALGASNAPPLTLGIRYARLQRLGAEWSADALVLLPESLGASAHFTLQMHGDPLLPERARGTLRVEGQRLAFAGWRAPLAGLELARYLPQSGSGNLELLAQFTAGRLVSAHGRVSAEGLEWAPAAPGSGVLALERLSGRWQFAHRGGQWHFTADSLELAAASPLAAAAPPTAAPGPPAATTAPRLASLTLDADAAGARAYGRAQHAPVAALAAIARWLAPAPALDQVTLEGDARELTFYWSAQRPAGGRLVTYADLENLTLASAAGEVRLSGLTGHVAGVDASLVMDLQGHDAQLAIAHAQPAVLDALDVGARLTVAATDGAWRLSADDLEVRRGAMSVAARGTFDGGTAVGAPQVDLHVSLRDGDVLLLTTLLPPRALATLGAAAHITRGRIESGDFSWRGPLDGSPPWSAAAGGEFTGTLALRDASLAADDDSPGAEDIAADIDWRGPRFHAAIGSARNGTFRLSAASLEWDARASRALHFAGHLAGSAQQGLEWLRTHPQLAAWAPALADIDLRGDTLVELEVSVPAASAQHSARAPPRVRVTALLDGGTLQAVAGLPPIEALRGTIGFAAGQLQRSTLTGQWLGGPVSVGVAERRERGLTTLAISGRGVIDARRAVLAAGGNAENAQLAGTAEWSALLTLRGGRDPPRSGWELHADSSLLGVASHLPEPFAKPAGAALPLHLELQAGSASGQLRVSLGDRLRAVAALTRSGDTWRIERGAVRLAGSAPGLPQEPVMLLDGRLSRLDLPAGLALWREAGRDAALPVLRAQMTAGELAAGAHVYAETRVVADAANGAGALELQSEGFSARMRWPAPDESGPASVHLTRFDLSQAADLTLAGALGRLLAPAADIVIDDLRWQGSSLGSLAVTLAAHEDVIELRDMRLAGAVTEGYASARCQDTACHLTVSLASRDTAATLAAFGLRPDIDARSGRLEGELGWSPAAPIPLATLDGHLHMRLEDGTTRSAALGEPFALFSVPALLARGPDAGDGVQPELRFARLTADYELRQGVASTSDLHFDGDAEILMRGRIGLVDSDYDEQAWVLRGEDRLPVALRRLGPTPRVAAAWLSLRELFAAAAPDPTRATLRLRGTWNDPIVTPVE